MGDKEEENRVGGEDGGWGGVEEGGVVKRGRVGGLGKDLVECGLGVLLASALGAGRGRMSETACRSVSGPALPRVPLAVTVEGRRCWTACRSVEGPLLPRVPCVVVKIADDSCTGNIKL